MIAEKTVRIYGENDRVYFLHIQKTAGNSFSVALQSKFSKKVVCPAVSWDEFLALPEPQIADYRLFRGHFGYNLVNHLPAPLAIVTLLRDPIDRTISNLDHIRRQSEHTAHADFHRLSLEDFIEQGCARGELWNLQTRAIGIPIDKLTSESYWDCDDATLTTALQRLSSFEFVGLVGKYAESLALLSYTFGWCPFRTVERLNASPNRIRFEDLSARAQRLIIEHNRYDLELYAAAEKLFAQRFEAMLETFGNLYYMSRVAPHLPRVSDVAVNMSQPISGDGWEEHASSHNSRWTVAPTATLELSLERDKPLTLRFRIIDILDEALLKTLKVFVNDHLLILKYVPHPAGGPALSAVITPDMLVSDYPFTVIRFTIERTISAAEALPNSTNSRTLGIHIAEVSIAPYHGSALVPSAMWRYRKFKRRFRWLKDTAVYRRVRRAPKSDKK